jgi:diguanylate cyclase (GGDEF)-like protein
MLRQQVSSATNHAHLVTQIVLARELRSSDLEVISPARHATLAKLFREQVLADGINAATLYTRDGRVAFSLDGVPAGSKTVDSAAVIRAQRSTSIQTMVGTRRVDGRQQKALVEIVPIRFGGESAAGAVVYWSRYATITQAARAALVPIAIILPLLLICLFVGLIPMLRRATGRMRTHLDEREFEALHDSLTGLPNRRLFEDRLKRALGRSSRENHTPAVMLLDLNGFKEVNDTLGHAAGDALLQVVAQRLIAALREVDTVARLGGDEFAVVLSNVDIAEAKEMAMRIHAALDERILVEGLSVIVGASIGIARYPTHGETASTLLQHADVAMYVSKRGHTPFEIYDADTDASDAQHLSLASDLRTVVEKGGLMLHYQPKLDLLSGALAGVEALLRWDHPTLGELDAERFMPLAEQLGLLSAISEFAVTAAIRQCAEWRRAGVVLNVAVNLDVRSLLDPALPTRVAELLAEHDVDADQLEFEITETSIMSDPGRVRIVAEELSRLGVRLAVDDFGTGYSSLGHLYQLPIALLKIDRSFVGQMLTSERDRIIVAATIELGHNLGIEVIAEGVENAETSALLAELGCDQVQGYHVGVPVEGNSYVIATADWAAV